MLKKMVLVMCMLSLTGTYLYADWLEDLALELGPEPEWNNRVAERIMEKYLQEDVDTIQEIEEKLKSESNGMLAIMHRGAYYVELKAAQSNKIYHEKVARILSELPENKVQRTKFLENLSTLYKNLMELKDLQAAYPATASLTEKLKARARIVAQQTVIGARKTLIKGSFLVS